MFVIASRIDGVCFADITPKTLSMLQDPDIEPS